MMREYIPIGYGGLLLFFGGIAAARWLPGLWLAVALSAITAGVVLFAVFAWLRLRDR